MGSDGKNPGSGSDWNMAAYNNAATAAKQGQPWNIISKNTDPNYLQAAQAGFDSVRGKEVPSFSMPSMPAMPDYGSIFEEQQAEAERIAGQNEVKSYFEKKYEAANTATDEVNAAIASEMSHAKQYGLDYNMTEAIKKERVNNVFAKYWSESDESALTELTKKWGDLGNKWESGIIRGIAPATDDDTVKKKSAGGAVPAKGAPKIALDDDEVLGSVTTPLGA